MGLVNVRAEEEGGGGVWRVECGASVVVGVCVRMEAAAGRRSRSSGSEKQCV